MLNKLLAIGVALLVAALLSVPAFAQTANPMLEPGSDEYLVNLFGDANGDITPFCQNIPTSTQTVWGAVFQNLPGLCGWSV